MNTANERVVLIQMAALRGKLTVSLLRLTDALYSQSATAAS